MAEAPAPAWSRRANRITSRWRAVGGKLFADAQSVRFQPNAFDRALAGREWSAGASAIRSIDVAPRRPGSHMFGAGLRRQLRIETADGDEYFVVNHVEDAAAELRRLLGRG